jgi:hypothetical protein
MPKKVASFFPRRKEGEEPDGRPTRQISVSYEDLEVLFHLPVKEAAREMNLCATTFKKACRSFGLEEWPFRKGQVHIAQTEPACPPDAPTLQTPGLHQANREVVVPCNSSVWHDESSERVDTSFFGVPFSSFASSSSSVRASAGPSRNGLGPFSTVFSGPMALDTRSYDEARRAAPLVPVFALAAPQGLLQQASMARDARSFVGVSLPPTSAGMPLGGAQGGTLRFEPGPPRELSCVEAVMDYLEGPLVGNFETFVDEEGSPEVPSSSPSSVGEPTLHQTHQRSAHPPVKRPPTLDGDDDGNARAQSPKR